MENTNSQPLTQLDYGSPEKVILFLKKNHDRAISQLLSYLDDLPLIEIVHSQRGTGRDRCDAWIVAVADLLKQRCADCIHRNDCHYQCIDCLTTALPMFCAICRVHAKEPCQKRKIERLSRFKEARRTLAEPFAGLKIYDCRLKFAKPAARFREASILTMPLPLYTPGADMGVARPLKLREQLHLWVKELNLSGNNDTALLDLACSIVALTHMFLSDLRGKTIYMGRGIEPSEPKDIINNESVNVLFAGMAHRNGIPKDEIMEILDQNEHQEEILVGGAASAYTRSWVIDPAEAEHLIDLVLSIYFCPVMPEFELKKIDPVVKKRLDDLCRKGFLRKTNVRLTDTGAINPPHIDSRFLHYRIYLLLATLLGAAKATHFTNHMAHVFQGDNLIKLWRYLNAGFTLESACKKIKKKNGAYVSPSAVIQALDRYKILHPRYDEYMQWLEKNTKTHDTKQLFEKSSLEEIKTWQENVNKCKINSD